MPQYRYSPEQFARAMSMERVGGVAFGNFTATGETLLMKKLPEYIKAFVEQGHYAEIVTNLTISPVIDQILSWDKVLLNRVEFKCSFHYLELKNKGLLDIFAQNVHKIWNSGASANIEMTPADDIIPYIEEIKEFCMEQFRALPHLTIARDDRTKRIDYLTNLSMNEYDKIWSQFDSEFWRFKKSIFGVKQKGFCYAGAWSYYVDLTTGEARQCYCGENLGNIFSNPKEDLPIKPIGRCELPHCFNGHMLMAAGLIPDSSTVHYGDIRNRKIPNGQDWLREDLLRVFNERIYETNERLDVNEEKRELMKKDIRNILLKLNHGLARISK